MITRERILKAWATFAEKGKVGGRSTVVLAEENLAEFIDSLVKRSNIFARWDATEAEDEKYLCTEEQANELTRQAHAIWDTRTSYIRNNERYTLREILATPIENSTSYYGRATWIIELPPVACNPLGVPIPNYREVDMNFAEFMQFISIPILPDTVPGQMNSKNEDPS